jgi:hypothetical protein
MDMRLRERLRMYALEPLAATFCLSVLANLFGRATLADFIHTEAHDILSLFAVLLGAALALWVGLFWISNTPFGQWLAERAVLETINAAYIATILILLFGCLTAMICAYLGSQHTYSQVFGAFAFIYGLATVPSTLSNTHKLLKLHGAYGRQQAKVAEMPQAKSK